MLRHKPRFAAVFVFLVGASCALGQTSQPSDSDSGYVPRSEYNQLKREHDEMRQEIQQLEKDRQQDKSDQQDAQQEISDQLKVVQDAVDRDRSGFEHFILVGDGNVTFTSQRKNASSFGAQISPIILWQLNDKFLVEAGFDIDINSAPDTAGDPTSATTFNLTIGDISYIVNDYLMVGGGLFVVPFGQYHNHFDPPWIDKLPDDPLAFDVLTPDSEVGIFARGAVSVSTTKVTYDLYATNGPQLVVADPSMAGTLTYNDFTDQNNNKAVGGRVGWLPMPNVEMGYSVQIAKANPIGFPEVRTLLNGVDLNVRQDAPALQGAFDYKTEWVWSNVERATYDPTGSLHFGPLTFSNYSDGGYVQLSYRPIYMGSPIKDFELVGRWDLLNTPLQSPAGNHEQRYSIGLDYWITPSIVLKGAYEYVRETIQPRENVFLMQLGFGL